MIFINGFVTNPLDKMFGSDFSSRVFEWARRLHDLMPGAVGFTFKKAVTNPVSAPLAALAGGFNLSLTSFKDIEVYSRGLGSMDLNCFLPLFESMTKYDGTDVLERIKVPVLIIGGKKDSVTPAKHQVAIHNKIKKSQLTLIPYGSHCTQLDLPDYVNLRMDNFFKDIGYLAPGEGKGPAPTVGVGEST
jgi:pimeloyl-ACP methyl ester carboxylesterase